MVPLGRKRNVLRRLLLSLALVSCCHGLLERRLLWVQVPGDSVCPTGLSNCKVPISESWRLHDLSGLLGETQRYKVHVRNVTNLDGFSKPWPTERKAEKGMKFFYFSSVGKKFLWTPPREQ